MAVIKTITTDRGVVFPDQYCRVDEVTTDKTTMRYTVGIYFSRAATELPPHRVEMFEASFDLYSSLNVWQQAYEAIKVIWADTIDA
jgi:hypothetical protein